MRHHLQPTDGISMEALLRGLETRFTDLAILIHASFLKNADLEVPTTLVV
jgi:hypothetical protein